MKHMKLLLVLAFLIVGSNAYAIPRTVPYELVDQDTGDSIWESQIVRLDSAHRYVYYVQTAVGETISVYISGDCKTFQVLSPVTTLSTGDDIISVSNANYPCTKLRVDTINPALPIVALALVKEGV